MSSCDECTSRDGQSPSINCNSLHKYYTAGSISSIIGASIVILTYIFSPKLREHPSVLIFTRCICDIGLALSFLVLDTLDINDIACNPGVCNEMGSVTLFFFLCSILYYGALQFDLFASINNPFSNPSKNVNKMHIIIILISFITTLFTRIEYSFVYRTDLQYCSLPNFTNNDNGYYSTALIYVPILSVMLISFIITIYSMHRLHQGLPNTFYIRRKAIFDAWVYSLTFMIYVSIVGVTYLINWEQQRILKRSNYNVTMLYALSSTTMGVVDCFVWFVTIYVHRRVQFDASQLDNSHDKNSKPNNNSTRIRGRSKMRVLTPAAPMDMYVDDTSSEDEDDYTLSNKRIKDKKRMLFILKRFYKLGLQNFGIRPTKTQGTMINEALRRELLAYTTDGIVQSVNELVTYSEFYRDYDIPTANDYPKSMYDKTSNTIYVSNVMIQHNWALLQIQSEFESIDEKQYSQLKKVTVRNCCKMLFGSARDVVTAPINRNRNINDNNSQEKLIQISVPAIEEEPHSESSSNNSNLNNNSRRTRASSIINVQDPNQLINKNRQFTSYAPIIFRYIRHVILNMSDDDYIKSIIPTKQEDQLRVLDNASGGSGQSGAFFYFTHDKRFIVKTIKKHEMEHFISILKQYVEHLKKYPSTILCRCVGLHSLTIYRQTQYYMIMENVFLSKEFQPHEKYDLKGSWVGRYTNYGLHSGGVMKDVDLKRYVILNKKKKIGVMKQLDADTKFLCNNQIMDYSLLLGIYHMKIEHDCDNDMDDDDNKYDFTAHKWSDDMDIKSNLSDTGVDVTTKIHDDVFTEGVRSSIIEGPGIYYFGIIDMLQKYSLRKRFETWFRKWIQRKDVRGISCVPPDKYRKRFMRYMNNIFIYDKKYKKKLHLTDTQFEKEQLKIYPPKQLVKTNMNKIKKTRHGSLTLQIQINNKNNNALDYCAPAIPASMPLRQKSLPALMESKPDRHFLKLIKRKK